MLAPFDIIRMLAGALVLYLGAEWLIRGSSSTARMFGVRPLVIGLTVIAYGTSAPELAVSTKAALSHSEPIVLGTVIGSCAANISLILGLTALLSPPTIDGRIIRREVPILLGSVAAIPLLLRDGEISRNEGMVLIACAALFTLITLTISARGSLREVMAQAALGSVADRAPAAAQESPQRTWAALPMMAAGLALLLIGSNVFVGGARHLAQQLGMSERMLGLTIVAVGTALPELISSIVAARKQQETLAVGTVIGANLMNVFLVLGVSAYVSPIRVGERMHRADLVGLIAITVLGVITLRGPRRIRRIEGALLVLAYAGFVTMCALW